MFYDKQGKKLDSEQFNVLFNHKEYQVVGRATLPDGTIVSTVWLGIDHGFFKNPKPVIFETMVFDKAGEEIECRRYATEEEALAGHKQAVGAWRFLLS